MTRRDVVDSIKRATVAIVQRRSEPNAPSPFKIIGSGFCVHPSGIVVTADHVFQTFVRDKHHQSVLKRVGEGVLVPTPMTVFGVLFFGGTDSSRLVMNEAVPAEVGIVNNFDIAVLRVHQHGAFPNGFPALEVLTYSELHEMMDVATCGYPFGDFLWNQVGSVTSSFTQGTMSAILPAQGVAREHLKGFQLDLFSAPGNSGGPVFCPVTGKVFGVLRGGPVDPRGNPILGITTAEPLYPAFDQGLVDKLLSHAVPPR